MSSPMNGNWGKSRTDHALSSSSPPSTSPTLTPTKDAAEPQVSFDHKRLSTTSSRPTKQTLDNTLASKLSVAAAQSGPTKQTLDEVLASRLHAFSNLVNPSSSQTKRRGESLDGDGKSPPASSLTRPPKRRNKHPIIRRPVPMPQPGDVVQPAGVSNFSYQPFLPVFLATNGTNQVANDNNSGALVADLFGALLSHGQDVRPHLIIQPFPSSVPAIERLHFNPCPPNILPSQPSSPTLMSTAVVPSPLPSTRTSVGPTSSPRYVRKARSRRPIRMWRHCGRIFRGRKWIGNFE
jgi:hypothetical protein